MWFVTSRWEVETAVLPCSTAPECGKGQNTLKSEESFVKKGKTSIRRAVLGRMQGWIDEEYKLEIEKAKAHAGPDGSRKMSGTGNALRWGSETLAAGYHS